MSREADLEKSIENMKEFMEVLKDINNHLSNENIELKRKLDGLEKVIIALVENREE